MFVAPGETIGEIKTKVRPKFGDREDDMYATCDGNVLKDSGLSERLGIYDVCALYILGSEARRRNLEEQETTQAGEELEEASTWEAGQA